MRVTVMLSGSAAAAAEDKTNKEYISRAGVLVFFMNERRAYENEKLSQWNDNIQYRICICADMSRTCLTLTREYQVKLQNCNLGLECKDIGAVMRMKLIKSLTLKVALSGFWGVFSPRAVH